MLYGTLLFNQRPLSASILLGQLTTLVSEVGWHPLEEWSTHYCQLKTLLDDEIRNATVRKHLTSAACSLCCCYQFGGSTSLLSPERPPCHGGHQGGQYPVITLLVSPRLQGLCQTVFLPSTIPLWGCWGQPCPFFSGLAPRCRDTQTETLTYLHWGMLVIQRATENVCTSVSLDRDTNVSSLRHTCHPTSYRKCLYFCKLL